MYPWTDNQHSAYFRVGTYFYSWLTNLWKKKKIINKAIDRTIAVEVHRVRWKKHLNVHNIF